MKFKVTHSKSSQWKIVNYCFQGERSWVRISVMSPIFATGEQLCHLREVIRDSLSDSQIAPSNNQA